MIRILLYSQLLLFASILNAKDSKNELWNQDRTAYAYCETNKFPVCHIVVKGKFVDVSPVTYQNVGKLGTKKIIEYENVLTEPIEWLENTPEIQIVKFKTEAWMNSKKYTVTESVVVKNGSYIKR